MTLSASRNQVLLGEIGAAQGLKGEVRLRSYTAEPAAIGQSLWLIVAAPQEALARLDPALIYPEDPKSLPPELAGRVWPPP